MGKEIGVGIIGLGMGANMLAINQDATSRLQVRALCDSNTELLQRLEKQHGVPFVTTDYRELVSRPEIDVVGIYSPDYLHVEQIEAATAVGKHIICTKPMVVSLEEARHVVRLVRAAGVKFLVGQTSRFVPRFMAAKKLYDDGDLGRPLFAEAHYVHDMRPVMDARPGGTNTRRTGSTAGPAIPSICCAGSLAMWRRCSFMPRAARWTPAIQPTSTTTF